MENLLKSLMKKKHHFVLTLLLIIFILFDIKIPLVFAELVDNPVGKIVVAISALCLLSANKLAGVMVLLPLLYYYSVLRILPEHMLKMYIYQQNIKNQNIYLL